MSQSPVRDAQDDSEAGSKARLEAQARAFEGAIAAFGERLVGRTIVGFEMTPARRIVFTLSDGSRLEVFADWREKSELHVSHGGHDLCTVMDPRHMIIWPPR